MSNLVKIKNVILSTTTQVDANTTAACDAARDFLNQQGIKFSENWYNDPNVDERTPVLNALSNWRWGVEGSKGQRQFTSFPILHWTECYDDWSQSVDCAEGVGEIHSCSLISNKNLVG